MQEKTDGFFWALIISFGAWGGFVRYLNDVMQNQRAFSWIGLSISGFVSGFFGVMLGLVAKHYQQDDLITLFAAGLGGAMGIKTLDLIIWYIQRRIGKPTVKEEENGN